MCQNNNNNDSNNLVTLAEIPASLPLRLVDKFDPITFRTNNVKSVKKKKVHQQLHWKCLVQVQLSYLLFNILEDLFLFRAR